MKYLDSITLVQYKNYESQKFAFDSFQIAIIGKNGSGKTNLLDAIYYLCFTKSYFNNKEVNNVQRLKDGFRIQGIFNEEKEKSKVVCLYRDQKKSISVNDSEYPKLIHHIGFQTAVMIAPDDINIINGYAENRRKFVDGFLSQLDPSYLNNLLQYQKYLAQKLHYLKNAYPLDRSLIQVYNDQLSEFGNAISEKRKAFTASFSPILQMYYALISERAEDVEFHYMNDCNDSNYEHIFEKNLDQEILTKRILSGIHLDDWDLLINNLSLKSQGSQGQKKTYLLAMKLAQIHMMNSIDRYPILLLDDIFEKLDEYRLSSFFDALKKLKIAQIFLTHTDEHLIDTIVKKIYPEVQIIKLKK